MAIQAGMLKEKLRHDGLEATVLGYNYPFPGGLRIVERVPGVRTFLRAGRFAVQFCRHALVSDVIHIFAASWTYFFLIVCPAVVLGRLFRKRIILNYRGGDAARFLERYGWIAKPFFRLAHCVTAPSGFLAQVIQSMSSIPVSIVPNIVDFSRFQYRERNPIRPRMLVTRHLEPLYGVDIVLDAFRQIQARRPDASLWIAGTGSQERDLRNLVSKWNLRNVRFLGHIDHRHLPAVYNDCDILINGSRSDNFPGSLMEGSAAGLVVVSTKAGGIPFIFEDEKNALLADIGDAHGLASCVDRILADPSFASRLIHAGRPLCGQCDWVNVRPSLFATYGFTNHEQSKRANLKGGRIAISVETNI
jgi:glycosyltransferase involved in cell wall biosynthesis